MTTPTPDPPPAAPLTAEEIAAIPLEAERTARYIRSQLGSLHEHMDELCQYELPKLRRDNAALRDRLARAEERERELREVLRDVGEEATTARAFGSNATLIRDQLYRIEDIVAESLATPTAPYDGAARMRELEENARAQHAELAESVATTNALIGEQMEIAKLLREIKYSALAGAEGGNVTSYEAGLKDALRAAEAALRIVEDTPPYDGAARAGEGGTQ